MEKLELATIEDKQQALLTEFETSKLDVDEFILKYFKEKGVANPEETLKRMDETFRVIDTCYDALKAAKESGDDRKVILRGICDKAFQGQDPEVAGRSLSQIISSLGGEVDMQNPLSYEGFDSIELIDAFDKALAKYELSALMKNGETM